MSMPIQNRHQSKQDYVTPRELIVAVKRFYGISRFTIDLAASMSNTQADRYFTEEDNSLVQVWDSEGGAAWLNPPYARIEPWVQKAYESMTRCRTLVLVPASVGSNWFAKWVHEKAAVRFLSPRIRFVGCTDVYPKDCMLLDYSRHAVSRFGGYSVWRWK